ncbi:hypothetical protein ZWY2020_026445 [Hordeum vulgare]|nr:hypothetical protein ZWY2020_026445 [Hordeum vulgare]
MNCTGTPPYRCFLWSSRIRRAAASPGSADSAALCLRRLRLGHWRELPKNRDAPGHLPRTGRGAGPTERKRKISESSRDGATAAAAVADIVEESEETRGDMCVVGWENEINFLGTDDAGPRSTDQAKAGQANLQAAPSPTLL